MKFFTAAAGLLTTSLLASTTYAAPTNVTVVPRGGTAASIVGSIAKVAKGIFQQIEQDKLDRSQFTQATVDQMFNDNPAFNYVIVHTDHDYQWDGAQDTHWAHDHQEFDVYVGGTIGYEIYIARSGSFTLKGDGGYLNWAYHGYVVSDQPDQSPRTVVFGVAP